MDERKREERHSGGVVDLRNDAACSRQPYRDARGDDADECESKHRVEDHELCLGVSHAAYDRGSHGLALRQQLLPVPASAASAVAAWGRHSLVAVSSP